MEFIILVGAFFCLRQSWLRATRVLAGAIIFIALAAVTQHLFRWHNPERILESTPAIGLPTSYWAVMAANASVAFVLCATALIFLTIPRSRFPMLRWAGGFCGAAVCVLTLVSLVWTLSQWDAPDFSTLSIDMSLQAIIAFLLFGLALILSAWRQLLPRWRHGRWVGALPTIIGTVTIALVSVAWENLERHEHENIRDISSAELQKVSRTLRLTNEEARGRMLRFANRLARDGQVDRLEWHRDAQDLLEHASYSLLARADATMQIVQSVPADYFDDIATGRLNNDPVHADAMTVMRSFGEAVSPPLRLPNGALGVYLYTPIWQGDHLAGVLIAAIGFNDVVQRMLQPTLERGYAASASYQGRYLFASNPEHSPPPGHIVSDVLPAPFADWNLQLWPTPQLLMQQYSPLPAVILSLGTALAVLLALSLRTGIKLTSTLQEVEHLNTDLERRVAERTLALQEEIAQRKGLTERLAHLAMHDSLTELPNRVLFQEHLEQALAQALRSGNPGAVMFLDVDHFKQINDTLGHQLGDQMLIEFARRVRSAVRKGDVVARHGGDEFLVLVQDLEKPEDAAAIAEQILRAMEPPVHLGAQTLEIGTSIGIAMFSLETPKPEVHIKHADAALYQAKLAGRGSYAFYSEALQQEIRRRATRRQELKHAIEHDELVVYYQPRVALNGRSLVGAEALVRWQRPSGELVMPGEFIPVAEESSLIVDLGEKVICRVIEDIQAWQRNAQPTPLISLNLSAKQLAGRATVESFSKCLAAHEELAPYLELELTESVLFASGSSGHRIIVNLADRGYRIAIDDFGTGYSSFGYLNSFPVDTLKIDRSFVNGAVDDPGHAVIVQTIADLARNFRLRCVAEGIETPEQLEFVTEHGCDEGQGYLFGRPMPQQSFQALWRGGQA